MIALPLIAGFADGAAFAYRGGVAISPAQYLRDVQRLAALLPDRRHVLNLCADRYHFAVGFGAALLRGQISLLPPNHTPDQVRTLHNDYADLYCLREEAGPALALETLIYPEGESVPQADSELPAIPVARVAAIVFTSGSTGTPLPHPKTWGSLVQSAQAEAARLDLRPASGAYSGPEAVFTTDTEKYSMPASSTEFHATPASGAGAYVAPAGAMALLGTVPPQHMYGFESTVLLPMQGGLALHAGRPFYPADIVAALEELPRPRGLVTTPVHLRALLGETTDAGLPAIDFMLCATAPLPEALAVEAEARCHAPLYEIYGCTEAGQVATRRPAAGPQWRTLAGLHLRQQSGATWVAGGHVQGEIRLGDVIELRTPETFELRGRGGDMVNIAGKRTSLAHLDYQLGSIPGVSDGAFLMPEPAADGLPGHAADQVPGLAPSQAPGYPGVQVTRLAAFVVAPGMSAAQVTGALRERIDAVFIPRPLILLDSMPRNSTGKVTRATLEALLAAHAGRHAQASQAAPAAPRAGSMVHAFAADLAAAQGHFPGNPIVPGAFLLSQALALVAAHLGMAVPACEVLAAKFPAPCRPGDSVRIDYTEKAGGTLDIRCAVGDITVLSAQIRCSSSTTSQAG